MGNEVFSRVGKVGISVSINEFLVYYNEAPGVTIHSLWLQLVISVAIEATLVADSMVIVELCLSPLN